MCKSGKVYFFDAKCGKFLKELEIFDTGIRHAMHLGETKVLGYSRDDCIVTWDKATGKFENYLKQVNFNLFNANLVEVLTNDRVAVCQNKDILIFNVETGET